MRPRSSSGFSLVEVMAALGVFAIVTLGVVPLLGSALKASSTSSAQTVAQEAGRNIMERIQGTKWYVSYDAKPNKRVDILDLYYPKAASNPSMGQSYSPSATNPPLVGTGGVFTTTCAPAPATTNPACNFDVPDGYTVTIKASFVKKRTPVTNPETYEIVTPAADYAWDVQGKDAPAVPLMDIDVTVGWTQHDRARTFSLRALLGERHFSAPAAVDAGPSPSTTTAPVSTGVAKIHGNASIDYVAQVNTGYSVNTAQPATGCPVAPCKSEATMTFGTAESTINTEDVGSTADQSNKVAEFRLVRTYTSSQAPPTTPPADLDAMTKAASVKHAPPYSLTATDQMTTSMEYLDHPDLGGTDQAMVFGGQNNNLLVDTNNELPQAEGTFRTWINTSGSQEAWFTNTQIDYAGMRLDSTQPLGFFGKITSMSPPGLGSYTKANSYALNSGTRAVETKAFSGFNQLIMLRFRNGSRSWNMFSMNTASANVNCKATGNPATASATASWTISWAVSYDNNNNGSSPSSPGTILGTISSTGADTYNLNPSADSLAQLKATNPLQYDDSNNANDIYLFEKRDPTTGAITQKGYISDIVPLRDPPTSVSADGRTASASIDGALRIDTAALSAAVPETATSISLIKSSCEAVDNR
jgi:prepilin-type N-terminal cleavage/methylation domain-containing protein